VPIEEPKFSLFLKADAFELRDYAPSVVAEVTVTGDQQQAGRKGFRLLAGYIFGGNRKGETISMTVPVTKTAQGVRGGAGEKGGLGEKIAMTAPVTLIAGMGDWLVRFTMPGRYALADLPVPNDKAVTLRTLPGARFAVLRFSGLAGEARVADQTARLLALVTAHGLMPVGPSAIARYNPPWTPWFLRRNEVMLPVAAGL
jgi:hypothetical protein